MYIYNFILLIFISNLPNSMANHATKIYSITSFSRMLLFAMQFPIKGFMHIEYTSYCSVYFFSLQMALPDLRIPV